MAQMLRKKIIEEEEKYFMIEGDYNARTSSEKGMIGIDAGKKREIRLIDKKIHKEGLLMLNILKERG